jgi:hypothetical protein
VANLNRQFNKLDRIEGWIFVDSALQQGNKDVPSLFIHMVKTDGFVSNLIRRYLPDGVLRILKNMFSGSYKIEPVSIIKNGSSLEQLRLSWQKRLRSGSYNVYTGLWYPESGKRLKVIDPGNNLISRERMFIGNIFLE